jgi:hypothetical protein
MLVLATPLSLPITDGSVVIGLPKVPNSDLPARAQLPLRRAHIAVAVAHLAALDEEAVDHPVAGEPVVGVARLELRVRAVAIEGARQAGGNLAVTSSSKSSSLRTGAKLPAR